MIGLFYIQMLVNVKNNTLTNICLHFTYCYINQAQKRCIIIFVVYQQTIKRNAFFLKINAHKELNITNIKYRKFNIMVHYRKH